MTHGASQTRGLLLFFVTATLAVVGSASPFARAEEGVWVAKVGERTLYLERLSQVVARRMRPRLQEMGSGPTTILRQMVEERAVRQEATRLGLTVTEADVDAKYAKLDREVKRTTRGHKNLEQAIREQHSTVAEFRTHLHQQLLKEGIAGHATYLGDTLPEDDARRLAQTEVVITSVLKRTDVRYGWKMAPQIQVEPVDLGSDGVARVTVYADALPGPDEPRLPGTLITVREFGEDLIRRLPSGEIRQIIQEECKAALTSEVALSVEAMTQVVADEEAHWNEWRELATQEAYRHLSYADYVKMRYKLDLDQMRRDRYFRGLFGLITQEREKITPEQVHEEWEKNREGLYGDAILVTDIEILFSPQNPLLGDRGGRERKDALRIANDLLRKISAGTSFDQVVRDVNAQRNMSMKARKFRVRNTSTGRLLFQKAIDMKDDQVSRPFETLSEVHVLRREKFVPAPPFEEVREMILEGMAQRNSHGWLEEQLGNPERVVIRWPLPESRSD